MMSSNDIENNVIEMNTKKETIMDTEKVKFEDIKTPTTVEEFRANLKRYYVSLGQDAIYVKVGDDSFGIPYSKISSFDDIYKLTKTGFGYGQVPTSPSIVRRVDFSRSMFDKFVEKNGMSLMYYRFFMSGKVKIYTNQDSFLSKSKNHQWYSLDNQVMREFYFTTLGQFSGYNFAPVKV